MLKPRTPIVDQVFLLNAVTRRVSLGLCLCLCLSTASSCRRDSDIPQATGSTNARSPSTTEAQLFTSYTLDGDILTGSQPHQSDLEQLSALGFRTVINLRTPAETGYWPEEQSAVEALGMRYFHIPVAGAQGVTLETAMALGELLAQEGVKPALVHCGSSNRAGALIAIKAFHLDGRDSQESLKLGRQAGLSGLSQHVESLLNTPDPISGSNE